MRVSRFILTFLNTLVSLLLILGLCVAGAYSGYALWDNRRVYAAAGDVQAELQKLKPPAQAEEGSDGPGFGELQAINPDVCAWLTLEGTAIDYPVLMGESNMSYLSTDVYGNFALSGSIFADSRNARDFSDPYTLIYGHHMAEHRMFGDLELYTEESFFTDHPYGTLILPDRSCRLESIACLQVAASEPMIFEPQLLCGNISGLLRFAEENALCLRPEALEKARQEEAPRLVALSTCSSDFTDGRIILLCLAEPYLP